jgi:hypothetical protein
LRVFSPASTSAASFASEDRQPASLSAVARRAVARLHGEDIGATVCIGERDCDRHLAAQRGI